MEKTSEESFFTYTSPLDDHLDQRLPGEQFNLNQQCQLALGNQYRPYISKRSPFNVRFTTFCQRKKSENFNYRISAKNYGVRMDIGQHQHIPHLKAVIVVMEKNVYKVHVMSL